MAGKGIVIQITGDGESAKKALEMVQEHLRETAEASNEAAGEMSEAWERVKTALEFSGVYMGLEELRESFKELILGSLELGEAMEKASRRTGLSVESLSVLHYAAGVLGTDFDGVVTAVGRMEKQIGAAADGNKQAGALMRALGLDARELAGRQDGAEIAFHRFVSTLAATENPIRRVQLAQQLLGRAGAEQIPMLVEIAENWDAFKAKAQSAGVLLTGETAESLAATNQRLQDMKQHLIGAGLALTEGMSPGLSQMFDVIEQGKGSMDTMQAWGRGIIQVLATVAETVYTAKGMIMEFFADVEGAAAWATWIPGLKQSGYDQMHKDIATANASYKKAEEMFQIAKGAGANSLGQNAAPFLPRGDGAGGTGYDGSDAEGGKAKHLHSDDAFAEARKALADAHASAEADARKVNDQVVLAELEAQHKMQLVGDAEFYREKLRLQTDELDAEQAALVSKQGTLAALEAKQHGDKTLRRDKSGVSAEELRTQRELVDVGKQLNDLTARRAQLASAATAEQSAGNQAAMLAGLKAAAELEKERGQGIAAQIALIRQEHDLEAQKIVREGGTDTDAANVRAQGDLLAKKLEIEDVSRRIADTEADTRRAVEELNDAAEKDPRLKRAATEQINRLNADEARQLGTLVAEYDALAQVLGGEFREKALDLHAELDKLNRPDQRSDAKFAKSIADGVAGMATSIAEKAAEGRESFHKMAMDMERDAERLALKLAEEAWLKPALEGTFAGFGGMAHGKAGLPAGPAPGLASMAGPSIAQLGAAMWSPPSTAVSSAGGGGLGGFLSKLAGGAGAAAGGKQAPSVTVKIENMGSQPVAATSSTASFDSEFKDSVIHIILENAGQGGSLSSLFKGGASG